MAVAVRKICDPELFPLSDAIQHAKSGAAASPNFEIELVRFLQTQCLSNHIDLPTVFRGLEVLGGMLDSGMGDQSRLIRLLRPFLKSSDPQIASKCVLVLGRQSSSTEWLSGIMTETDGRVRANLIEALWKRKEPEVELVLRNALRDLHPRVAANAVYGLYLLGVGAWVEGLERLVGSRDAKFRISGIWMLKLSGAPDAAERIKRHIGDTDPDVRRAAFDALKHLRENGSKKTAASADPLLPSPSAADPAAA
jgi:HEAT repeat protein